MRRILASAGIATLVALVPVSVEAQSRRQGTPQGERPVDSNLFCLARPDWEWVLRNNPDKRWASTTKDEKRHSPRFATPCGQFSMPAGTENYGYRGRVTGQHYLHRFPKRN